MNRIGSETLRRLENGIGAEITLSGSGRPETERFSGHVHMARLTVGPGVNRHRSHTQAIKGANDTASDFPTVGD